MKRDDIRVGRWYAMRPSGVHRDRVLDGDRAQLVKVLGIGAFTYVRGECDRKEIKPTDQHSTIKVHVAGKRPKGYYSAELEDFEDLVDFRDILLTKKEWEEKSAARAAEMARVDAAVAAHEAAMEKLRKLLVPALGAGVQVNGYRNRSTVTITFDAAKKILSPERGRVLDELVTLQRKPRAEVTC